MKFSEIVEHTIGGGWGSDEMLPGDQPVLVIRGADFPRAALRGVDDLPLRFEPVSKAAKRILQADDIVLETSGGTKDRPTGRTVIITEQMVDEAPHDLIPASFCRLIRVQREKANPVFVYYLLQNLYSTGGTWEYQNQSTGIANFQYDLFRTKFILPELGLDTQNAIASVLGSFDDKIAANSKLAQTALALLEAQFSALGLDQDPSEDDAVVSLDQLLEFNPKSATPSEPEPVYVDMQKLPVRGMSISSWDHRPARGGARFRNGDTLLARITPCLENRKTGFVDFLDEGQVGIGSTEFIVLRSRPGIPPELSYFIATSERFRSFAIRHMVGTSGRQRVSALDLTGYTLTPPHEEALTQFGIAASSSFTLVRSLTAENRTLAATRDALVPQLVSGKLRVKDAEKVLENAG